MTADSSDACSLPPTTNLARRPPARTTHLQQSAQWEKLICDRKTRVSVTVPSTAYSYFNPGLWGQLSEV